MEENAKLIRHAILTDPNASWRKNAASAKQRYYLARLGIEHSPDITAGEAADLIRPALAELERQSCKHS